MQIQKITYLGHSSIFVECAAYVIAIDPWLDGNPLCPDQFKTPEKLDLIILTHGHFDHAGEAKQLATQYGASLIANYELAMLHVSLGVPQAQVIPMNKGGTLQHQGLSVTLTHAFHSSSYDTPSGTVYAGEPCGVVLRDGKTSIYHAGDTALFSDMKLIGELYKPQIALLPIGDRFTMGPREAAMAASFIGCQVALPIHYKTFDMLTGTAEEFSKECERLDVKVVVLEAGGSYMV